MANIMDINKENEDKIIEYMSKITGVKYSDEQLDILHHHGGMCILASAGSGKTTMLSHLIIKRIQTREIDDPKKLLCTTFSRAGASEMSTRANEIMEKLRMKANISFKTINSICVKILKDLGYNIVIIEDYEVKKYVKSIFDELKIPFDDGDDDTIITLLSYQINNILSDEAIYNSYIFTLRDKITLEQYSYIRQMINNKKSIAGKMTHDDVQLMVFSLLRDKQYGPAIKNYISSLWNYICVDEAQDTSRIQFEILKALITDPNKLIIIGDDDQCVYEWRGSDPSILLNICGIYTDLTLKTLTTNYRCRGEIVERASHGITFNKVRSNKTMKPYLDGGSIKICDCEKDDLYIISKKAFKYIKELIIDQGVSPADIAVIGRNNNHMSILSNMLFKDGIYPKYEDKVKFTSGKQYYFIKNLINFANDTTNISDSTEGICSCTAFINKSICGKIAQIQSIYGITTVDALGILLNEYSGHKYVNWVNPGFKVNISDFGKYSDLLENLKDESKTSLCQLYDILSISDKTARLEALIGAFTNYKSRFYFKSTDETRTMDAYSMYIKDILKANGFTGLQRFMQAVEQFEEGGMAIISPMVTFTTAHNAKGREWKYVVLLADDNTGFLSFDNINKNIGEGVPETDIHKIIDGERRLHYVAMTRAKEELAIFAKADNLCIFALESMGIMDDQNESNSNIVMMAQHGIYKTVKDKIYTDLLSKDSKYRMDIDIGILKTSGEQQYEKEKLTNNTSNS